LDTARYLHKPYFQAKKMTKEQIAVFVAERKWTTDVEFGFAAALLETLPFVGLILDAYIPFTHLVCTTDTEKVDEDSRAFFKNYKISLALFAN
ncbi:hypothetical protein EDB92DRAFT_1806970, partial [Lactarius akahatsu]